MLHLHALPRSAGNVLHQLEAPGHWRWSRFTETQFIGSLGLDWESIYKIWVTTPKLWKPKGDRIQEIFPRWKRCLVFFQGALDYKDILSWIGSYSLLSHGLFSLWIAPGYWGLCWKRWQTTWGNSFGMDWKSMGVPLDLHWLVLKGMPNSMLKPGSSSEATWQSAQPTIFECVQSVTLMTILVMFLTIQHGFLQYLFVKSISESEILLFCQFLSKQCSGNSRK